VRAAPACIIDRAASQAERHRRIQPVRAQLISSSSRAVAAVRLAGRRRPQDIVDGPAGTGLCMKCLVTLVSFIPIQRARMDASNQCVARSAA
jgi:hypothetical protein